VLVPPPVVFDRALEPASAKARVKALDRSHFYRMGQEDLVAACDAIAARSSNDETKFHKIVDYVRRASRDRFDDYYSFAGEPCGSNPPRTWKLQFSTGVRFDRDGNSSLALPILFATFRWLDDSLARRSPLSVATLLGLRSTPSPSMFSLIALKSPDPLVAFRLSAALAYVALDIVGDTWLCFANLERWRVWGAESNQFIVNEDRGCSLWNYVSSIFWN
jgi:hypothetical protein